MEEFSVEQHRRRAKDKFINNSFPKGTPPHEILEFLLFYSISRKDTKPIAKNLLQKFGSLENVFNASITELEKVDGIGEHSAILIKLIPVIADIYNEKGLSQPSLMNSIEEIGTYLLSRYAYFGRDEVFSILSFDNRGRFINFNVVEKGDIASVGVSTRKVIEILLATKATSVVIAHNHPSGLALPSDGDLRVTETLYRVLKSINVTLVDHLILINDDFVSLAQSAEFKNLFKG